jgi:hypothetical protein
MAPVTATHHMVNGSGVFETHAPGHAWQCRPQPLPLQGPFCSYARTDPSAVVYNPGKYRFVDFLKTGTLLTLILAVIALLLITFFWPLR